MNRTLLTNKRYMRVKSHCAVDTSDASEMDHERVGFMNNCVRRKIYINGIRYGLQTHKYYTSRGGY